MLKIQKQEYVIPPHTFVSVNYKALMTQPSHWGSDNLDWKPSRWVEPGGEAGQEKFLAPAKDGFFTPWAYGPRTCPGRKFSQVEFVTTVATLLCKYRIEPARRGNETLEQARDRLLGVVKDSHYNVTPRPNRPDDAGLTLIRR